MKRQGRENGSAPRRWRGGVRFVGVLGVLLLWLVNTSPLPARAAGEGPPDGRSYLLRATIFGGAGSSGSTATLRTVGTLGQSTPAGTAGAGEFLLYAGFWRNLLMPTSATGEPRVPIFGNRFLGGRPNPCAPGGTLRYSLAAAGPVELEILDVSGRRVRTLLRGTQAAGVHEMRWDGRSDLNAALPSGVYFCRLSAGSFCAVERLMLVR